MKILANDGIGAAGKALLEQNGVHVDETNIPQAELSEKLSAFDGILVRSATQVTQEIIDANPQLKVIGRGGVGMDNIAVDYARGKGIAVINTPLASTRSVAELSIALLLAGVRQLSPAFQHMPKEGHTNFKTLKKTCSKGLELKGRTLGLIGFGNIGKETAKIALGLGMKVMISTSTVGKNYRLDLEQFNVELEFTSVSKEELLQQADFISLHMPKADGVILGKSEFEQAEKLIGIVNTARGTLIDEAALTEALDHTLGFAALDVFHNEPNISQELVQHSKVVATPHIGGSTSEAQDRVWIQIAEQILDIKGQH